MVHIDKLKHVVLALVGRGEMGCFSESVRQWTTKREVIRRELPRRAHLSMED